MRAKVGDNMKAKLAKKNDVMIVSLSGRIDVEFAEPFREACLGKIAKSSDKIVFNMNELSFVGSNGIMPFVRTMMDLAKNEKAKLKFCEVSSEFKKIFAASPLQNIEIFESEDKAVDSFADLAHLQNIEVLKTNP